VKVAAAFTTADADKDGYLSKAEFSAVGEAEDSSETPTEPESSETPVEPQQ
jgi:hypothetical protein